MISVNQDWIEPILLPTLQYLFQNLLVESDQEVRALSTFLWRKLVHGRPLASVTQCAKAHLGIWLGQLVTPAGVELDGAHFLAAKTHTGMSATLVAEGAAAAGGGAAEQPRKRQKKVKKGWEEPGETGQKKAPPKPNRPYIGGPDQESAPNPETVLVSRSAGADAVGFLMAKCAGDQTTLDLSVRALNELIMSHSSVRRQAAMFAAAAWGTWLQDPKMRGAGGRATLLPAPTAELLVGLLTKRELVEINLEELMIYLKRMRLEVTALLSCLRDGEASLQGIPREGNGAKFDINNAIALIEMCPGFESKIAGHDRSQRCKALRASLTSTTDTITEIFGRAKRDVQAGAARALIFAAQLPEKVGPLIKVLVPCIRDEPYALLQTQAANALSKLLNMLVGRAKDPNSKIVPKLCAMLCKNPAVTPQVAADAASFAAQGILTLARERDEENKFGEKARGRPTGGGGGGGSAGTKKKKQSQKAATASEALVLAKELEAATMGPEAIQHRGGAIAIREIAAHFGATLPTRLGCLWQKATAIMAQIHVPGAVVPAEGAAVDPAAAQALVDEMQLLETLIPALEPSLVPAILQAVPAAGRPALPEQIFAALRYPCAAVRFQAAQLLGAMVCTPAAKVAVMHSIVQHLLPLLGDAASTLNRQGAAEAVFHVTERLGLDVLPYLVILVIPLMGRLSDFDTEVRQMTSRTFATLIRLMPLEAGAVIPEGMAPELVARRGEQRQFLDQLLDPAKLDVYKLPVQINADLRSYQQAGLDWMHFLKKYQLHGILCDDMGLGKTLQSICIIAGSQHEREASFAQTGSVDHSHLPSLVICPPTLTAHWENEIRKFTETLAPLQYAGPPHKRQPLRSRIRGCDVLIMSYETLRSEIDYFQTLRFNYCVLDEGHIIKNPKSRVSQAVKRVYSNHRLMLSGTPLQNRVQELWSLFDFLMPGFLGTESYFWQRYGRAIAKSRGAKVSSTEEEAGTKALEELHRQVNPFLLRRMKEDVLDDLPPKIIQDYSCHLTPLQLKLHDFYVKTQSGDGDGSSAAAAAGGAAGGTGGAGAGAAKAPPKHIFQTLQFLKKLTNHPSLVLTDDHPLRAEINKELRASRTPIGSVDHSGKMVALRQLLFDLGIGASAGDGDAAGGGGGGRGGDDAADVLNDSIAGHRCLIFAQSKAMLDIVANSLFADEMPEVSYDRLDGGTAAGKRQSIVDKFNQDPTIDCLLLTTAVGGLGLTLTGADTVIFLEHDWNPAKDMQAMDRAYRIGQKRVVNVYRLITRDTLEEKIMSLQQFKQRMADTVISSENKSIESMGTDRLLDQLGGAADRSGGGAAVAKGGGGSKGGEGMFEDTEYNFDVDSFAKSLG